MFPARASALPSGASLHGIKPPPPELAAPLAVPARRALIASPYRLKTTYTLAVVLLFSELCWVSRCNTSSDSAWTKMTAMHPQNQTLTLQALASFASIHRTLQFPGLRPDSAISLNNPETLRQSAVKASPNTDRRVFPKRHNSADFEPAGDRGPASVAPGEPVHAALISSR